MKQNNFWYSVIFAILMVWFMIILTSWVFFLVLWENKDSKAMEYYLKSYMWAEGALELGLLKFKNYNYSFSENTVHDINNFSVLLSSDPMNKNNFKKQKDTFISYEIDSLTTNIVSKTLSSWKFEIIPLFSFDNNKNEIKVQDIKLSLVWWDLVWNILWEYWWISWTWSFTKDTLWNYRTISSVGEVFFSTKSVWDFLSSSNKNYLILHNVWVNDINFDLISNDNPFIKNIANIIASWETFWYKQNLKISVNLWEYLNLLKYSVFSPN